MSFLFRYNQKAKKLGGNAPAQPAHQLSRANTKSIGGSSGGQVQIHRSGVQKHKARPNQQSVAQKNVQGVISMEEVMADLRILEDQQNDSQRKLKAARMTKKRLLEQQVALESKLDRLKYRNGQTRAELQRAHNILCEGQHQLNSAKLAAASDGDDLREFDRKMKMALEIKRKLLAYQRIQDRQFRHLHNKVAAFERLSKEATEQCEMAKMELSKARNFEETLRQRICTENANRKDIADKTAQVRAESVEQDLELASKSEASLKLRVNCCSRENAEETTLNAALAARIESDVCKHSAFVQEMKEKSQLVKHAYTAEKKEFDLLWHRVIEIQVAEDHTPSQLPSQTNAPPVLDLKLIEMSVQAESGAAETEAREKTLLVDTVESLRAEIAALQSEQKETTKRTEDIVARAQTSKQAESERKIHHNELNDERSTIMELVRNKQAKFENLQEAKTSKLANLKSEIQKISDTISAHEPQLSACDHRINSTNVKIEEMKVCYEMETRKDREEVKTLDSNQEAAVRYKIEMMAEIKKENEKPIHMTDKQVRNKNRIEAHRKETEKIQLLYPVLAETTFNYRPDLSSYEQAEIDLEAIFQDYKSRSRAVPQDEIVFQERANSAAKEVSKSQHESRRSRKLGFEHLKKSNSLSVDADCAEESSHPDLPIQNQKGGEKYIISAAKPKTLLGLFSQVESDEDYIEEPLGKKSSADKQDKKVTWDMCQKKQDESIIATFSNKEENGLLPAQPSTVEMVSSAPMENTTLISKRKDARSVCSYESEPTAKTDNLGSNHKKPQPTSSNAQYLELSHRKKPMKKAGRQFRSARDEKSNVRADKYVGSASALLTVTKQKHRGSKSTLRQKQQTTLHPSSSKRVLVASKESKEVVAMSRCSEKRIESKSSTRHRSVEYTLVQKKGRASSKGKSTSRAKEAKSQPFNKDSGQKPWEVSKREFGSSNQSASEGISEKKPRRLPQGEAGSSKKRTSEGVSEKNHHWPPKGEAGCSKQRTSEGAPEKNPRSLKGEIGSSKHRKSEGVSATQMRSEHITGATNSRANKRTVQDRSLDSQRGPSRKPKKDECSTAGGSRRTKGSSVSARPALLAHAINISRDSAPKKMKDGSSGKKGDQRDRESRKRQSYSNVSSSNKRSCTQASDVPSQGRPSKSRRRKSSGSSVVSKPKLSNLGGDYEFNF